MRQTYREILQGYLPRDRMYAFAYGCLDGLIALMEDGFITEERLRREAFQLRCAIIARETELADPARTSKFEAVSIVTSRVMAGDPMPRKSVEHVVEKNDGVAGQESSVTDS